VPNDAIPVIDLEKDFGEPDWHGARAEMTRRLHKIARAQAKITYSELCDELRRDGVIALEPHGSPLAWMLGQINVLEARQGRPLISSLVVHKSDDWLPGVGFWSIAKLMGLDIGDTEEAKVAFWAHEFGRCHAYWKGRF
jgi:hypothetical protein